MRLNRITIDPGISGTGWAVWDRNWKLLKHGVIFASSALSWEPKTMQITDRLYDVCIRHNVSEMHIEYPAVFGGAGGAMVAGKGDIVKLAFFVGHVCAGLQVPFHLVEVRQWKGQLPKDVVIRRIKKILPDVKATSHDWDAIGIGLFKKGDLQ